jgi:acyl-CoA synthetase (AMP-forming)/AMP-acid ligase II
VTWNLADLFESVVDTVPEREAVVAGERRLTYAQLEERSNRLAHHLAAQGITAGDHVGLMLVNGSEYLEGMLAAFKLRAVPINVNYRYVAGELHHVFDDADLASLVVHRRFAPCVAAIAHGLPKLRHFAVVDDGSEAAIELPDAHDYEAALKQASPQRAFPPRSGDDRYIVYTGGTTGAPKGVVWRHEDIFFAAMGGGDPVQMGNVIHHPEELPSRVLKQPIVALPAAPFMHAAAQWLAFHELFAGGTLVLTPRGVFDPAAIWDLIEREHVNLLVIVGDAMALPLVEALASRRERCNVSSLVAIASGGALFSPAAKARIAELLPGKLVIDGLGASETGQLGRKSDASASSAAQAAQFRVNDETAVLDDELEPVEPGSGRVGRLARRGHVPLGYHKDPAKSAATFVEVRGERWALPGDMATVEADGTIRLLGRGSLSINTGGEKVFPEEVEAVLKEHSGVVDAVVVGVPDPRWGERVVAVVQPRAKGAVDAEGLRSHCATRLARYKIPRDLVCVDEVVRSPAGKADYRWARDVACKALVPSEA